MSDRYDWEKDDKAMLEKLQGIAAAHDAAHFENFIWEATHREEILVPGMLPYGWEMGPFGPVQVLSAAPALRLMQEQIEERRRYSTSHLGGLVTAPNIATMNPTMNAKLLDVPLPSRRWWAQPIGWFWRAVFWVNSFFKR